jgi:2-keto-3-deoxy-L-rhamnonate aldolase RhmA
VSTPISLKQRINSGETVYGQFILELFTPGVPQILSNCGLDFLIFDMEHGRCDLGLLAQLIVAANNAGIPSLVRVPDIEFRPLSRVLDMGAIGVVVPRVETPEQAHFLVAQLKYAPEGSRGVALGVAHDRYRSRGAAYFEQANRDALVIALLETTRAFENLDEILRTPGLDVAWMGHYDLTVSMGIPAQFENPRFLQKMDQLLDGCGRHHLAAGFLTANPADTMHWIEKGFRVISLGTDIAAYQNAVRDFRNSLQREERLQESR